MRIFTILCTRARKINTVTRGLCDTLSSFGSAVKVMPNQRSIFEAYVRGRELCEADPNDVIIFCHDDIQIRSNSQEFTAILSKCLDPEVGIVGPAGTTYLDEQAVWWNHDHWSEGKHRGLVTHVTQVHDSPVRNKSGHPTQPDQGAITYQPTEYGPWGQVVVLDGLFLAARAEVWDKIGLDKPPFFEGLWDFYDIYYTTKSHLLGFKNYAAPFKIIHHSGGSLAGRDSWHKNRTAYIEHFKPHLPLELS